MLENFVMCVIYLKFVVCVKICYVIVYLKFVMCMLNILCLKIFVMGVII